ncbi:MAG: M28 family peptidase [Candidatus Hodarchaeota archaeon]
MRVVWLILMLILFTPTLNMQQTQYSPIFDGANALSHLNAQCDFGPRPPGSDNLSDCRNYIMQTLEFEGWTVALQNFTYRDIECANVIARYGNLDNASIILGAHYDTRPRADKDPDSANWSKPILGANDGASGVAVLLELARTLSEETRESVELVFFDAEDSGGIDNWDWIVGSTHYVDQLDSSRINSIIAMVLFDMVGDVNLRLPRERSSTRSLQDSVWSIAADLEHENVFLDSFGGSILDDHTPFLLADIPALDIIHHSPVPPYWHTMEDTPDKCSAESLEIVGEVVESFIVQIVSGDTNISPTPPIVLLAAGFGIAASAIALASWYLIKRRK